MSGNNYIAATEEKLVEYLQIISIQDKMVNGNKPGCLDLDVLLHTTVVINFIPIIEPFFNRSVLVLSPLVLNESPDEKQHTRSYAMQIGNTNNRSFASETRPNQFITIFYYK